MAAFEKGGPAEADVNLEDILSQMFGFGMGGPGGPGGGGPRRPRRGPDEEQKYEVTLEEMYKGKTVKFSANKQVICVQCNGSGAKEKVKPDTCPRCRGQGMVEALRQIGPMITKEVVSCDNCQGTGNVIKEKDRCKKCKGKRTTQQTKVLEIYIPPGARHGEQIVLEGEADQIPDQTPGDIVFTLVEEPHDHFTRIGQDLSADLNITLAEALTGFSRTVLTHLDGRGIHITRERGQVLHPNQVLKISGEGMPIKRSDAKGDLYLMTKIAFPDHDWLKNNPAGYEQLLKVLPGPAAPIAAEEVDEVEYDDDADLEQVRLNNAQFRYAAPQTVSA
jgi:DnaJ family protein A protein 2